MKLIQIDNVIINLEQIVKVDRVEGAIRVHYTGDKFQDFKGPTATLVWMYLEGEVHEDLIFTKDTAG